MSDNFQNYTLSILFATILKSKIGNKSQNVRFFKLQTMKKKKTEILII